MNRNWKKEKLISKDALDEWTRVVRKPLWSIYKWTLAVAALMALMYKPTEIFPHAEYLKQYLIYPAIALGVLIVVIECFFRKIADKLSFDMTAIIMIILINLYVVANLFSWIQIDCIIVAAFLPIVVSPIYKKRNFLYFQVGISMAVVLIYQIYLELSQRLRPEEIPFSDIFAIGLLFYAMVKLELEVITSANILGVQSTRDSLTKLFNHEKFYEILEDYMSSYAEKKTPFSIIIADIDNFKKVNDTYGHAFGDEVIKKLAQIMTECKGTKDICARYGGEEFVVITSNKELNEAVTYAEKMRTVFNKTEFITPDGEVHHFSISLGVAEYNREHKTASAFFELADKALYEAKENGKNRVCCSR